MLRSVIVEPVSDVVARLAGLALTLVPNAQTIDAIAMASAACRRGEIVYTSDPSELTALRDLVPQLSALCIERA